MTASIGKESLLLSKLFQYKLLASVFTDPPSRRFNSDRADFFGIAMA
jgi:hypothetical protein